MFAALWRMFCQLFGLECDPGCGPQHKPEKPPPEEHNHGLPERSDDKPGTYWTDLVDRPIAAGDSSPERLRSLPDEQKTQEAQSKGRSR